MSMKFVDRIKVWWVVGGKAVDIYVQIHLWSPKKEKLVYERHEDKLSGIQINREYLRQMFNDLRGFLEF